MDKISSMDIRQITKKIKMDLSKAFDKKFAEQSEKLDNSILDPANDIIPLYSNINNSQLFTEELNNLFLRNTYSGDLTIEGDLKCNKLVVSEFDSGIIDVIIQSESFQSTVSSISNEQSAIESIFSDYMIVGPLTGQGADGPSELSRLDTELGLTNSSGTQGYLAVDYIRNRHFNDTGTSSYDRGFLGDFFGCLFS